MKDLLARSTQRGRWSAVVASVVVLLTLGFGVPVQSQAGPLDDVLDPPDTLPNLVPDVQDVAIQGALVFDPGSGTFIEGPPEFRFDTRAQNLGAVSLELTSDADTNPTNPTVSQCVSWVEGGRVCREHRQVGGFTWHDPHNHFHYEEFAAYELRRLRADGRPDYSDAGLVAVSDKVSFCLIDSEQVRDDAFQFPYYFFCGPTLQGVSSGWTDIYDASLPGQQFPLDALSDGRYALVIRMDYANRLYESDDTDNLVEVTVEFSGGVTQVAIVDKRWPGPDDGGDGDGKDKKPKKPKKDKQH